LGKKGGRRAARFLWKGKRRGPRHGGRGRVSISPSGGAINVLRHRKEKKGVTLSIEEIKKGKRRGPTHVSMHEKRDSGRIPFSSSMAQWGEKGGGESKGEKKCGWQGKKGDLAGAA